ncbi:hypothetical protein [Candidatus Uabimicrobium sp. HlEnr_7]|uniref:hypothetical protein n=1 Tax=Candidatus Uabimicrobium helgolandensis TaxID=3095367 RepID=UPI0035563248
MYISRENSLFFISDNITCVSNPISLSDILAWSAHDNRVTTLGEDGTVSCYDSGCLFREFQIKLLDNLHKVAISYDGSTVVCSVFFDHLDVKREVYIYQGESWLEVPQPDFLVEVNDIWCAPYKNFYGYSYLTGQPHGGGGSYGDRMYGILVCEGKETVRDYYDTRSFDEEPSFQLFFGENANPLLFSCENEICVDFGIKTSRMSSGLLEVPEWDIDVEQNLCSEWITRPCIAKTNDVIGFVLQEQIGVLCTRDGWLEIPEPIVAISLEKWPKVQYVSKDIKFKEIDSNELRPAGF